MTGHDLLDSDEYRSLHPASKLVLLTLRLILPRKGWGRLPGRNGALAELTGLPMDRVGAALGDLTEKGLVYLDGGMVYLTARAARRPTQAPRPEPQPKEAPKKRPLPTKHEYSPEFEEAWALYPKREGGNPKRPAYKAWRARLAEGVSPEQLIQAVKRYAAYIEALEEAGELESRRFVLQATTFFGPNERWKDDYEIQDGDAPDPYSPYGE